MTKFPCSQKVLLGLALLASTSACISTENPTNETIAQSSLTQLEDTGEENLRRSKQTERNYFERFSNNLFVVPGENFVEGSPANAFYPGSGVGNSTHMGKAKSFINQFSQFGAQGLETVGRPVTMFFENELKALGIVNIPDEVSSITTDGKGNSVWFKSLSNQVRAVSETRSEFQAEVAIIGGTGKFAGASGFGSVKGFFNPIRGEGASEIRGRIKF